MFGALYLTNTLVPYIYYFFPISLIVALFNQFIPFFVMFQFLIGFLQFVCSACNFPLVSSLIFDF